MSGMDKVFQTILERQRAPQTLPLSAERQSNASLSSDDDTLELSSTASTSSQTTDHGKAGTSFRSEHVVLKAPRNFIDNKELIQVLDCLKLSDNASQS